MPPKNYLVMLVALATGGCAVPRNGAPPVNAAMVGNSVSLATLEQGRTTFTTSCTACHAAQPIDRYTLQEWSGIVDGMAIRAHLDATRKAALMGYLTAVKSPARS